MRILFLSALAIFHLNCSAQDLNDFKWLEGHWERQNLKPGKTAFENWKFTGSALNGFGTTLMNNDTVFTEKLQIIQQDDSLYYVAKPSQNKKATYFKIIEYSSKGFTSINPKHDFPKQIVYQLKNEVLFATISDSTQSISFTFKKRE